MICLQCLTRHLLPTESRCPVCGGDPRRGMQHVSEPLRKVLSKVAEAYARQHDKETV